MSHIIDFSSPCRLTNGDKMLDPDELFLSCFEDSSVRKRASPPSSSSPTGDQPRGQPEGQQQRVRKTVSLVNRSHDSAHLSEEFVRKLQLGNE
jgi:hypothetical protein